MTTFQQRKKIGHVPDIQSSVRMKALLTSFCLVGAFSLWITHRLLSGPENRSPEKVLKHAIHLVELDNWTDADPEFSRAENMFTAKGDKRNALYAHLGKL